MSNDFYMLLIPLIAIPAVAAAGVLVGLYIRVRIDDYKARKRAEGGGG